MLKGESNSFEGHVASPSSSSEEDSIAALDSCLDSVIFKEDNDTERKRSVLKKVERSVHSRATFMAMVTLKNDENECDNLRGVPSIVRQPSVSKLQPKQGRNFQRRSFRD